MDGKCLSGDDGDCLLQVTVVRGCVINHWMSYEVPGIVLLQMRSRTHSGSFLYHETPNTLGLKAEYC